MCYSRSIDLTCEPSSVPAARRFLVEEAARWGLAPTDKAQSSVETALLITSELVSNAVKAWRTRLRLEVTAHRIVIAVSDDSESWPVLKHPDWRAKSGRGIAIVDAVCSRWGWGVQSSLEGGKQVWAHIPIEGETSLARACQRTQVTPHTAPGLSGAGSLWAVPTGPASTGTTVSSPVISSTFIVLGPGARREIDPFRGRTRFRARTRTARPLESISSPAPDPEPRGDCGRQPARWQSTGDRRL